MITIDLVFGIGVRAVMNFMRVASRSLPSGVKILYPEYEMRRSELQLDLFIVIS